ncbi:MAG TPA: amidase [Polyangiaceae bacterium]
MKKLVPRLSGSALTLARLAAENPATNGLMRDALKRMLGVDDLAQLPESLRGHLPMDCRPIRARVDTRPRKGDLPPPSGSNWPPRASAYVAAYRTGRTTPLRVAERALSELTRLAELRPTMNVVAAMNRELTLGDAEASTRRYAQGSPLGPLDGVPLLVKDQHDVAGLPTSIGSPSRADVPARRDATVVARLREAGAIVLGKSVLTEWGLSSIGANVHVRMPHNPFDPNRAAGGSSTGSAVGVALGLGPLATAGDGGGSIRVPASLNGIFGLKPTFGRISRAGDRFHDSVAVLGPLAVSTVDLALFLDTVASAPDPEDEVTAWAPPGSAPHAFASSLTMDVRGLCIGIEEGEWADASPDLARAAQDALRALEARGAVLRSVKIALAVEAAKIGYLTIGSEGLANSRGEWLAERGRLGDDLRLSLGALAGISALEYLDAQRLRQMLRLQVAETMQTADVLALPCTATSAPRYTERDAASSFTDPKALDGLCRFVFLANLTGLPAASAPVGSDGSGLPVGLQIVGDAWDESTVLGILAELERQQVASVRRSPHAVDLLGD